MPTTPDDHTPHPHPHRRPTLDEIFGDVLPDTTSDDRDPTPPTPTDDWYTENRPPHHDR
jgi:hypothetical protein